MSVEHRLNKSCIVRRSKPKYTDNEHTYRSHTFSNTNATWIIPEVNPDLHSKKSTNNCLGYAMAWKAE